MEVRLETLRWIADAKLPEFRPDVDALLRHPDIEYPIYEACLAARNTLSGNPDLGIADAELLISTITNPDAAAQTRAYALRLLDPNHRRFSADLWRELYATQDPRLVAELTRALAAKGTLQAREFLLQIADDESLDLGVRGDALAGLAGPQGELRQRLIEFSRSEERTLREEALRSLRFAELDEVQRDQLERVATHFPESADLVRAALDAEGMKQSRPPADDISAWQMRLVSIEQPVDEDSRSTHLSSRQRRYLCQMPSSLRSRQHRRTGPLGCVQRG